MKPAEVELRGWILDRLCREWLERLPLAKAGYAEAIDSTGRPIPQPARTMLVQARLAYVFTHAGCLGRPDCAAAGKHAVRRMAEIFWRAGAQGWARGVEESGGRLDETIDTYDQAFGLLALAWDYRVTGDPESKRLAELTLEGLERFARDPVYGGYLEQRGGAAETDSATFPKHRRQNPHMHLLEAFLAWQAADSDRVWRRLADDMVALLRRRFLDPVTGGLGEFFDQAWRPADGAAGLLREPGHHFEWVWLLRRYAEAGGDSSVFDLARTLYRLAGRHGVDADGLAFDGIDAQGTVVSDTKLLWPQTEMIKAHLAMYEWTSEAQALAAARAGLAAILDRYMQPGGTLWYTQLDRAGRPLPVPTLSRLLYHLFVALVEADRVLSVRSAK
jgi:mannose/cellobiose epimerase-like protein (N-acyl-D-glucosamine 2-epimerase family)